ncbi:general secretion pathway protein GspB [Vreelandella neptunia]|uniref:general secretion pathway protein GspB n=1 Tax=Vreelandella neptunia TaxID=115551 RepID=UPI00315AD88E
MKRKYLAAVLLAGAVVSCALANQLASAEERAAQGWHSNQDSQLQSLDARLAEKVREFLELNELLSRQLEDVRLQQAGQNDVPLLTGNELVPEPVEQVAAEDVTPPAPPEPAPAPPARQAPWWSHYKLSMVVYSDDARSAVINGRYVQSGDALTSGVVVHAIAPHQVTLARGGETARLTIGAGS